MMPKLIKKSFAQEVGIHLFIGFPGTTFDDDLRQLIDVIYPGGIVLFKRNVIGYHQLKALIAEAQAYARHALGRPLLFAIDQEGGTVQRLNGVFPPLPSAHTLAQQGAARLRKTVARAALELKQIGIHINFAPVLDLVAEPANHFLGTRSLGPGPLTVAELGRVWIDTLQENTVSATAKHFPGLGLATLDPHDHLPTVAADNEEVLRLHLQPFAAAIAARVHAIMTSHALYPHWDRDWPGSLSTSICFGLLRQSLGFRGILFSDDLDMQAIRGRYSNREIARRGLEASIDGFLLCQEPDRCEDFLQVLVDEICNDTQLRAVHQQSRQRLIQCLGHHFGRDPDC